MKRLASVIGLPAENREEYEREELVLTHLHPGVSVAQLQDATGFEVRSRTAIATTQAPSAEELRVIRDELDPLGVRRLEFVPSTERSALIEELLTAEEYALSGARS